MPTMTAPPVSFSQYCRKAKSSCCIPRLASVIAALGLTVLNTRRPFLQLVLVRLASSPLSLHSQVAGIDRHLLSSGNGDTDFSLGVPCAQCKAMIGS